MKKLTVFLFAILAFFQLTANDKNDSLPASDNASDVMFDEFKDSLYKALQWQHGEVLLSAGQVKLNIPAGFKYLNADQSKFILEKLWGNLEDGSVLGMIFPSRFDPWTTVHGHM